MGAIIDTSILIAYERRTIDIAEHIRDREEDTFFLSVISASEMLHGVHRAVDPAIRARRLAFVEAILSRFPILGIELDVARAHAKIWGNLAQYGNMIGVHDSWIAATCIARDLSLITANLREFERIPGLRVENWLSA